MMTRKLTGLLFPSDIYCIACGSFIDGSRPYALCDSCLNTFRWANGKVCEKCGKPLSEDYHHGICVDCRETNHSFEKGYCCVQYGIYERELLLSFKYGGKTFIGEKLALIMADRLEAAGDDSDFVIPVPMHRKKLKKRGFNQAEIIAANLAKKLKLPYSAGILLRTGYTTAMSRLTPEERRINIENAFSTAPGAAEIIKGKKILLVDDIYTTGSTASACSMTLTESGARRVRVIAFAAGANLLIPAGFSS